MEAIELKLPEDPEEAVRLLKSSSESMPALVLKTSPRCGVSGYVEEDFQKWLSSGGEGQPFHLALVDVVADRDLARGLSAELGIRHESPQALLFRGGEFVWHGSHYDLSGENFEAQLGDSML